MPARKKPNDEHQFKVGDSVSITLHTGLIVDGTVKAIVEKTDGIRLHVDYGINTAPNLLTVNIDKNENKSIIRRHTTPGRRVLRHARTPRCSLR